MLGNLDIRQIARQRLEKAAKDNGYELDKLPKLSEDVGFAVACQSYAKLTRSELERVDLMTALTRASAFNRMYRA